MRRIIFNCKCGETNPSKFYGNKRSICGKCHNKYTIEKGNELKKKVVEYLGGGCINCGYNKFMCSLDIHHKDPKTKDKNFLSKRGWSWSRIEIEINKCILLCRNCHQAFHSGLIKLPD